MDIKEIVFEESDVKALRLSVCEYKDNRFVMISHLWRKKERDNDEWQWSQKNVTIKLKSFSKIVDYLNDNRIEVEKFLSEEGENVC